MTPTQHAPRYLTAVQMEVASACSRCAREVPLLAFAFLDENYACVCVHCVAGYYNNPLEP